MTWLWPVVLPLPLGLLVYRRFLRHTGLWMPSPAELSPARRIIRGDVTSREDHR
jgi:hypothetical protein